MHARLLLALASVAVAFAAADTYVVVLALPDMMTSVGVPIDELQRAAPIISGFLLGYVAMLPMIGRIADLRGRVPVLMMALVVFAVGSFVTALAYDMPSIVVGRFFQGVGGGALVPATLGLVADLYPVERRGIPLGVVSAVQEIGSVIGPLFGAVVLAVADWRAIFAINLVVGLLLAVAIRAVRHTEQQADRPPPRGRFDFLGLALLGLSVLSLTLVFVRPMALLQDLTWGALYVPYVAGGGRWVTPMGAIAILALVLMLLRWWTATRPLIDLRSWLGAARDADLVGSALLAIALGGIILAFATADPEIQVFSENGRWFLLGAGVAIVLFAVHLRSARAPIVPRGALSQRAAWGALVVSFLVGAALIAALIDIPLFARTTIYPESQLDAALVLVRFLIALPIGAVIGGYLIRSVSAGLVTAIGMVLAAVAFVLMAQWDLTALRSSSSTFTLLLGGLGFGLALAPVNAAVLAATHSASHGLASAMVVVARMVGMLVGISALTTLGLRRYYAEQTDIPPVQEVCDGKSRCAEYTELLKLAGIAQEHTVFLGAAGCAVLAAVLALVLFRGANTRGVDRTEILRAPA